RRHSAGDARGPRDLHGARGVRAGRRRARRSTPARAPQGGACPLSGAAAGDRRQSATVCGLKRREHATLAHLRMRGIFMTVHYPRSFLGLLLAGFTLVTVPLVAALAYSAWNTERLAVQSRSAVFNASQAARASRSLVDRIGSIERLAQQIALLDDPELVAGYARVHRAFQQLAGEISQLPLDEAQAGALR